MTSFSKKLVVILYLSATIPAIAHASAQTDAFAAGQALANGAQASTAAGVTNGSVANTVNSFNPTYYQYSTNAPQTSLYQGGNGDTISAGAGKITACQTGATNPDQFLQQNCNAINFMAKNPSTRPQFSLSPTDTNITLSKAIQANAPALAANSLGYANPAAVGTSFSGCTNTTVTTPATYQTEVCNDFNSIASQTCTMGQTVVVNANTSYQCNKTSNAYQTYTCTRGSVVTVSAGQCTQGAVLASFVKDNACPACGANWQIHVTITCGANNTYIVEDDWYYPPGMNYQSMYQAYGYTAYPAYMVDFITTSQASVGTNFTNKPIFSSGNGCSYTMYLTQLCSGMACSLNVSESGNCSEGSYTLPAQNVAVPYTVTANFSNDTCTTLEAQAK